jgi:hypothetical protein
MRFSDRPAVERRIADFHHDEHDGVADLICGQRARVDRLLREMLMDDSHGFGRPVIEVHGTVETRAHKVVSALKAREVRSTPKRATR